MIKNNHVIHRRLKTGAPHVFVVGLILLCLTSCGYKLAGGGKLPADVRSVCVLIFDNRSTETGIENQLVSDLIYEFTRNGQNVVSDPKDAQAILSGVVKSVSVETVSYNANQTSLESRVTVVANVTFKTATGEVIWSTDGLVQKQAFSSNRDDKQAADKNKKDALLVLSKRFAENVYARLTDDF